MAIVREGRTFPQACMLTQAQAQREQIHAHTKHKRKAQRTHALADAVENGVEAAHCRGVDLSRRGHHPRPLQAEPERVAAFHVCGVQQTGTSARRGGRLGGWRSALRSPNTAQRSLHPQTACPSFESEGPTQQTLRRTAQRGTAQRGAGKRTAQHGIDSMAYYYPPRLLASMMSCS